MAGLFERIRASAREHNHSYVPSTQTFLEVDVDKVKRDLKLEDEGRRRGKKNQPASESTDLDEVERLVTTRIQGMVQKVVDQIAAHERTFDYRLRQLNLENRARDIRAHAHSAESDLDAAHHGGVDRLYGLRRQVLDAERDLETFQRQNQLSRQAHYPASRFLGIAIIFLLILVESVFNASIFGEGHQQGLIGGYVYALFIALLNVLVLGMLGAKGARLAHHVRPFWKGLGIAMLGLFAVLAGGLNLLGAHLRESLRDPSIGNPTTAAWESFAAQPFGVNDAMAWIFVTISTFFAIGAAIDFYKLDDPYPGYGDVDRRRNACEEAYADTKAELIDEMTDIRDTRIGEMQEQKAGLETDFREYSQILSHRASLFRQFQQHLEYLETTANTLLSVYREANRAARDDEAPQHFGDRWRLERPQITESVTGVLDAADMRQKIEDTSTVLEEAIRETEERYREHLHRYNAIEDLPREKLTRVATSSQAA